MKFCVFGAGAIGGYLAVELALCGQEVCIPVLTPPTAVRTPMIDSVLALVQARGRAAGLYVPLGSSC